MADEDLSEPQLKQLLKDAEERLRKNEKIPQISENDLVKNLQQNISSIAAATKIEPYVIGLHNIPNVETAHLIPKKDRIKSDGVRIVVDPIAMKKKASEEKKATAGTDWYNLPRTRLTPELKRDLQLLRMRDVLDPKRHYKKDSSRTNVPEFSQVGTIIEGPTEYFSGRLSNKQRKKTLVEETLENENITGRYKKKYNEIQAIKTSGKKAHYNKLKSKRIKGGILNS
ncbi:putative rrna-processing protein fcf2 protein [Erysiphe necator]|uniref:Putative rrna-processing protein fcf2 protein n=1 Tax=Uncinula necator TaxID=52586 RepID=A0A0B1P555_UNCNE|nr:putative rrna-processing protein fcf2 protein [Erysiphe necator]